MKSLLAAFGLLAAAITPALADNAGYCGGFNMDDPFATSLYQINGAGRTNFVKNTDTGAETCPSAAESCKDKDYLVKGDKVVVVRTNAAFACAVYRTGKEKETHGWLPLAALDKLTPVPDWKGKWTGLYGDEIKIVPAKDGKLKMDGEATYKTTQSMNSGDFHVTVDASSASTLAFATDGEKVHPIEQATDGSGLCALRMNQLGPYLAVGDNGACGGLNVTFSGLYMRK